MFLVIRWAEALGTSHAHMQTRSQAEQHKSFRNNQNSIKIYRGWSFFFTVYDYDCMARFYQQRKPKMNYRNSQTVRTVPKQHRTTASKWLQTSIFTLKTLFAQITFLNQHPWKTTLRNAKKKKNGVKVYDHKNWSTEMKFKICPWLFQSPDLNIIKLL